MRADVPAQSDYAYGFTIETREPADFYRVELPLVVYESATDPSLRDLGIYDGDGQPVPRALQTIPVQRSTPEQRILLNVFALPDTSLSGDDIRMILQHSENKISVEVDTNKNKVSKRTPTFGYIVDVKDLKQPLTALEFQWQATDESFLGQATVTGSDDLIHWQPAGQGAVAAMQEANAIIVQREVTLTDSHHEYLRVVFDGVPDHFTLTKTTGIYAGSVPEAPRQWLERTFTSIDNDGAFIFDIGPGPRVDRVHVRLPADNVVIRGSLSYWSTERDRWVPVHRGIFYHLRRTNHSVQNTPITIPRRRASRWKLTVETGRKNVQTKLAFGWQPDRLVFVAQGKGPYTLVAGRAADALDGFPQQSMFGDREILSLITHSSQPTTAYLGQRFELQGPQALATGRHISWLAVTLWTTLILGVGLIGWMVVSLVRQLPTGGQEEQ